MVKILPVNRIPEDLVLLEARLREVLQPVTPDPNFIQELKIQLQEKAIQPSKGILPRPIKTGILLTGGLIGGVIMLIAGIRAVMSLIGVISLVIQQIKNHSQATTPTSIPSPVH